MNTYTNMKGNTRLSLLFSTTTLAKSAIHLVKHEVNA